MLLCCNTVCPARHLFNTVHAQQHCNCCLRQSLSTQQVNNAGILVRQTWDKETYDNTLSVNTAGPVLLSQALLPLLAPGALIVNVSSSELVCIWP
jgi:NAD(P)-dependent dehydrogenase (short-subunit alcohol dehydrogenase family)